MASGDSNNDEERARRAAAELKETEDLLAGFDRPGRTPRTPPVKRDFVDYHLEKRRSNPAPRSGPAGEDRARRDLPTAIIPGHKRTLPPWLPWAGLLFVMSLGGVLVAAAVSAPSNAPSESGSGSLASAATTLASGTPSFEPTTGPARDIPPPPPSTSEATSADENAGASPGATTAGTTITAAPAKEPMGTNGAQSSSSAARRPASSPGVQGSPGSSGSPGSASTAGSPASTAGTPAPSPSPAPSTSATVDLIRNL